MTRELALGHLSHVQRTIILLRYGLGETGAKYSRNDVARILRVRLDRVRYQETEAVERLNELCPDWKEGLP